MAYIYDLVDNWNNAGVTFTAIKMNVTDSNSAAGSLLMDLQVGGASRFRVDKSGGLIISGGTQTTSSPVFDATQTWNAGAVTFTGLRFNAAGSSDANSASGSLLMDLQVGGSSRFSVRKDGYISTQIGLFIGDLGRRVTSGGSSWMQIGGNGIAIEVNNSRLNLAGSIEFQSSFSGVGSNVDLSLGRRAAASLRLGAADTSASATITVTIASPGVVTWSNHGLTTGTPVVFSTDGALPTGITAATTYYAIVVNTTTFQLATSFANALAGTAVNTSGSQSGTHTGRRGAIAQTLGVQDTLSTSSLENIDGADFVIRGSRGIGNKPGGSIVFQVAPAGSSGTAQGTLATALTITSARRLRVLAQGGIGAQIAGAAIGSSDNTGIYFGNDNSWVGVQASNGELFAFASGASRGLYIPDTGAVAWSSGPYPGYNALNGDVFLRRDAANTLAQRNDNNGQTFRLYGRFTDITNNFERFFISAPTANGSAVLVGTQKGATTGSARAIEFQTDSVTRMTIANTGAISITSSLNVANTVSAPNINSLTSIIAPMLGAL